MTTQLAIRPAATSGVRARSIFDEGFKASVDDKMANECPYMGSDYQAAFWWLEGYEAELRQRVVI